MLYHRTGDSVSTVGGVLSHRTGDSVTYYSTNSPNFPSAVRVADNLSAAERRHAEHSARLLANAGGAVQQPNNKGNKCGFSALLERAYVQPQ